MDRRTTVFLGALLLAPGGVSSAAENTVRIDGSSTVYPITEAVAEEFQIEHRGSFRVTVGISGTGGGLRKFCRGDIDIADASRPIKESERKACAANGISYIELPVALDALAVVVNPANDRVSCITVAQLRAIWEPAAQEKILAWNQVDPAWPDRPLRLFGPGTDSGTYDYFTAAVIGEEGASRGDFTASEDDNVLVQGVANDPGALGYFGFAYYIENRDKLKAVAIRDPGSGDCVMPSVESARSGRYRPLSRPLFLYVDPAALERPAVAGFMEMYLDPGLATELVTEVGYVPLPEEAYVLAREKLAARRTGTAFAGGAQVGISIEDLIAAETVD